MFSKDVEAYGNPSLLGNVRDFRRTNYWDDAIEASKDEQFL